MKNLKEYCRPATATEAEQLKRELGARAVYLAGGTDLLVHRPQSIERAIDIRHAGLNDAGRDGDEFVIGGSALLADAEEAMKEVCGGMLRHALRETAPWLIRNAATVAGNIANASPAADGVPALLAVDAVLSLSDTGDTVPLASVFVGPHRTNLGDRLIRAIRIPGNTVERQGTFIKLARSKSDIAQVNVAVSFRRDGDRLQDVRIALGAVAPTPMRATETEMLLEGEALSAELLAEAGRRVAGEVRPISDWRASADYRRRTSAVLVQRALREALALQPGRSN